MKFAQNSPFTASNAANVYDGTYVNGGLSGPGSTDVGSYINAHSFYGTFDQGGNVYEWNEGLIGDETARGILGGDWFGDFQTYLGTDYRGQMLATTEHFSTGFRVASVAPIPEASTFAALAGLGVIGFAVCRRRWRQ